MYISNTGANTITDAAINNDQSVVYKPWNDANPIGNVFISIELVTINGHIKSFHAPKNTKVPNVASAGFDNGNMILQ